MKEEKGARDAVKEQHPSTQFLFGGNVKGVAQDIKDSEELNPLALNPPKKLRRGGSGGYSGRGSSGAGGSFHKFQHKKSKNYGAGRGKSSANRGDRLSKFKED